MHSCLLYPSHISCFDFVAQIQDKNCILCHFIDILNNHSIQKTSGHPKIDSTSLYYALKGIYLRNKTCFPCLHSLVKTEVNVWENSRADQ